MAELSEELWAEIRKEFGEHCMRRFEHRKANENFRESLQRQTNKLESVYRLANSQAREANLDESLKLLNEKSGLGESTADAELRRYDKKKLKFNFRSAAEFKHHFKCNLQECDCFYENNDFEQSLLLTTDKARRYQNAKVDIPHSTARHTAMQAEARKRGPKVLPLTNRFEMVKSERILSFLRCNVKLIKSSAIKFPVLNEFSASRSGPHEFRRHDWQERWKLFVQPTQIFRQNRGEARPNVENSFW